MIKYKQLSKRSRAIVDAIEKSLRNDPDLPPDVHVIKMPNGDEKNRLMLYLAQMTAGVDKRTTYVSPNDESVLNLHREMTKLD